MWLARTRIERSSMGNALWMERQAAHTRGSPAPKARTDLSARRDQQGQMRGFLKNILYRLLGAGGYVVINPADYQRLQSTLAEAKGGVSQIQQQVGETLSHMVVLRGEVTDVREHLAETKSGVSQLQSESGQTLSHMVVLRHEITDVGQRLLETKNGLSQAQSQVGEALSQVIALRKEIGSSAGHAHYDKVRDLPLQLDIAASGYLHPDSEGADVCSESRALGVHYARLANLVSRYWVAGAEAPADPYPDDDMSPEYAIAAIEDRTPEEAADNHELPSLPWRQLWSDPDCAVLLVLGQSNAANHGEACYVPARDAFSLDFRHMRCRCAADPLPGASGAGGSIWSRLGDLLIEAGVFRSVLFVPLAVGESSIKEWIPEGKAHRRTALALSRLRKELNASVLPFCAVLWQQGETDANQTQMSAQAYKMHFHDVVADLRADGVFAPVFVSCTTFCETGPHLFENRANIRQAQLELPDATFGIFAGPDTDAIGPEARLDGYHFSEDGLGRCAKLWLDTLSPRCGLLKKLDTSRASVISDRS
jgi:Carbohydrate esterase, sialic acid-specific acetylesterase